MDIKGKTIAVIGGCGFIGSHLTEELLKREPRKVIIIDIFCHGLSQQKFLQGWEIYQQARIRGGAYFEYLDARNKNGLKSTLLEFGVDLVFNCAVLPLLHSLEHPEVNFNSNMQIVMNLLELQKDKVFCQLIHFSSSEVYGSLQVNPMKENHPIAPSTPYAAAKAAGDLLALSYQKMYNLDLSIIRPFNNYGPRQNEGTYAGVIPLMIKRLISDEPLVIFGDGNQTRDYIYVKDTAIAAIFLARHGKRGEVYNVCSGMETSINQLTDAILKLYLKDDPAAFDWARDEKSGMIRHLPDRIGDVRRHVGDCQKIKKLGFHSAVNIIEGMAETVDWYRSYFKEPK